MKLVQVALEIFKVGACTALFLIGIYFLMLSRREWEVMVTSVLDIPDLEVSPATFIFIKFVATGCLLLSCLMVFLLFVQPALPQGT